MTAAPISAGQQLGHDEVEREELHHQRDVAQQLDVGARDAGYGAIRNGSRDADRRAQRECDRPRDQSQRDSEAEAREEPAEIRLAGARGAEKDPPVPVIQGRSVERLVVGVRVEIAHGLGERGVQHHAVRRESAP